MDGRSYHPIGDAFDIGRSIRHGFAALRLAVGPLWLGGLLILIAQNCTSPGAPDPTLFGDGDEMFSDLSFDEDLLLVVAGVVAALVLFALTVGALLWAFQCWVTVGFIRLQVNVLEHASGATAPLFSGKDRFWHMLGWSAIERLVMVAAFFAGIWPGALLAFIGFRADDATLMIAGGGLAALVAVPLGVYAGLGTFLGAQAVVLEGKGPTQALRRSWALARGNRWPLALFALVCLLLMLAAYPLGFALCCVGVFVLPPLGLAITGFARTEGFLLMTRGVEQAREWRLWQLESDDALPRPMPVQAQRPAASAPMPHPPSVEPRAPRARQPAASDGIPHGWDSHLERDGNDGNDDNDDESDH